MGDRLKRPVRQTPDHVVGKLSAGQDPERDALTPKALDELGDAGRDLPGINDVLRVHMRCRNDRPGPVRHRGGGQRDALADRSRPIVDAR